MVALFNGRWELREESAGASFLVEMNRMDRERCIIRRCSGGDPVVAVATPRNLKPS